MAHGWRHIAATCTLAAGLPLACIAANEPLAGDAATREVQITPIEVWPSPTEPANRGDNDADVPAMYRLPPVEEPGGQDRDRPAAESQQGAARGTSPKSTTTEEDDVAAPGEVPIDMLDDLDLAWPDAKDPEIDGATEPVSAVPYTPSLAELSQQLLPSVRRGYGMARHGAVFAAQAEFIKVLRRIAEAKDAQAQSDGHARALAAGLRALDEADDFMPTGTQLEAEIDVVVVASSHRTPEQLGRKAATPHEAVALYHDFARRELGRSVAGERAGSMALYGLGKLHNRLAYDSDMVLRHERKAMTMFLAALEAGPDNHLAANEVGVLLARGGRAEEAAAAFRRAIDLAPTSTAYHNLAEVERKLGQFAQADANERYAAELAARDRAAGRISQRKGIRWVDPQQLSPAAPVPIPGPPGPAAEPPRPAQEETVGWPGVGAPASAETVARWPQKLIPSAFRR